MQKKSRRSDNIRSGFMVMSMLLAFVALFAFASLIMGQQAREDLSIADERKQISGVIQQIDVIRNLVRQCAGKMRQAAMVETSPSDPQPYPNYPGCVATSNAGITSSQFCGYINPALPNDLNAVVEAIKCPLSSDSAQNRYLFDPEQSIFNLSPISGFGSWVYVKSPGLGVYIQIKSTPNNPAFAEVLSQVTARYNGNELTNETFAANNADTIGVFIYRDPASFPNAARPPAPGQ